LGELNKKVFGSKKFKCSFCDRTFNDSSNKYKHQQVCKVRALLIASSNIMHIESSKNQDIETMINTKVEKLEQLVDKKISQIKPAQIITYNITGNQINSSNNIHGNTFSSNIFTKSMNATPRNFGFENMDAIPKQLVRDCFLNIDMRAVFENLHFDPNFPENHNVRIKSTKKQQIEMFTNDKWTIKPYKNGINEIIRNLYRIFDTYQRHNRDEVEEDMTQEELHLLLDQLEQIYKLSSKADEIRKELICSLEQNREENEKLIVSFDDTKLLQGQ
jgi:hypothetical protein